MNWKGEILIFNVDNPYILWVGIALLAIALVALIYRLVQAGLLTAGLDERQSKIVASVLIALTGVYVFTKALPFFERVK